MHYVLSTRCGRRPRAFAQTRSRETRVCGFLRVASIMRARVPGTRSKKRLTQIAVNDAFRKRRNENVPIERQHLIFDSRSSLIAVQYRMNVAPVVVIGTMLLVQKRAKEKKGEISLIAREGARVALPPQ